MTAWTYVYRVFEKDGPADCPQCGTRRDPGERAAELVNAPARDDINESYQSGFCSRSCARLWGAERGWTVDAAA